MVCARGLLPDTVFVMMKRYKYRAYPDGAQQVMLARSFGCRRVVYNDFIARREHLFRTGQNESMAETAKAVTTEAKTTPEREFLAGVPFIALQQAAADAQSAYRSFFDSATGRRKGSKVRRPRFKSRRDNRQSMRLTRSAKLKVRQDPGTRWGFVWIAKVGWLKFASSRDLPTAPSSVTVIRQADGRYYVSFVVETSPNPAPAPVHDGVGIDVGITSLAVLVSTDGEAQTVENRRHLVRRQRKLARAQRALSRCQKGSKNREKARVRVAIEHRKVREARLDHHHKLARRLVDENQAIAVEDLHVAGMIRNRRLAKHITDAGWSTLLRLIREKAAEASRTVTAVDRFHPSSQLCSACGCSGGKKELSVRQWSCTCCGEVLDRDFNAAVNLMIAAGLAEISNACGGSVRPDSGLAEPVKQEPAELVA